MEDKKAIGYLIGDDGTKEPMYLSEKAKKELEEIRNQVYEDNKEFFDLLDKIFKPYGRNHKDVIGFETNCFVYDKETNRRVEFKEALSNY